MNFDYSDDQKFLKSEARKFLDARATAKVNRAVLDDPTKSYDPDLWKAVAEMEGRMIQPCFTAWCARCQCVYLLAPDMQEFPMPSAHHVHKLRLWESLLGHML